MDWKDDSEAEEEEKIEKVSFPKKCGICKCVKNMHELYCCSDCYREQIQNGNTSDVVVFCAPCGSMCEGMHDVNIDIKHKILNRIGIDCIFSKHQQPEEKAMVIFNGATVDLYEYHFLNEPIYPYATTPSNHNDTGTDDRLVKCGICRSRKVIEELYYCGVCYAEYGADDYDNGKLAVQCCKPCGKSMHQVKHADHEFENTRIGFARLFSQCHERHQENKHEEEERKRYDRNLRKMEIVEKRLSNPLTPLPVMLFTAYEVMAVEAAAAELGIVALPAAYPVHCALATAAVKSGAKITAKITAKTITRSLAILGGSAVIGGATAALFCAFECGFAIGHLCKGHITRKQCYRIMGKSIVSNLAFAAGSAVGALVGGVIGTVLGPIGSFIGSVIGACVGGLLYKCGVQEFVDGFYKRQDKKAMDKDRLAAVAYFRYSSTEFKQLTRARLRADYRRIAKDKHPDKRGDGFGGSGNDEPFIQLVAHYTVLDSWLEKREPDRVQDQDDEEPEPEAEAEPETEAETEAAAHAHAHAHTHTRNRNRNIKMITH